MLSSFPLQVLQVLSSLEAGRGKASSTALTLVNANRKTVRARILMTMKTKTEYRLYILIRNDLQSLNSGKAMAQAAHAANSLTAEWGHLNEVREYTNRATPFGTAIVLSVDKDTLVQRLKRASMREGTVPYGPVWDTTYPFNTTTEIAALIPKKTLTSPTIVKDDGRAICFRKEITCGYIFVGAGTPDQVELVGDLPLYP